MSIPAFLVLDLDDTILDYNSTGEAVWKWLFRDFAPRMGISVERLQQAVNDSRQWYWTDPDRFREGRLDLKTARRKITHGAFEKMDRTDRGTADELADAFTREREIAVQLFDGALDALNRIRRSGARMVLLTNGDAPTQRAKIERFRLAEYFQSILIEGETGVGNPDPRAHRAALAALEADPQSVWMVGDDWECDIAPAMGLGMRTVWICEGEKSTGKPADLTIPSLRILADYWSASE